MRAPLQAMVYVPCGDVRKLDKIPSLPAPAFILDLEDAVALSVKPEARRHAASTLTRHGTTAELWVRVNSLASGLLYEDVRHVVVPGLVGIVLPKTTHARDVQVVDQLLSALERTQGLAAGSVEVIALVESAEGLRNAREVATASPRLRCFAFGTGDFSLDLGLQWPPPSDRLSETVVAAKAELVLLSREAGLEPPHDGVYPDFRRMDRLRAEAEQARDLGFGGKHAIHPDQVPTILEVFAPSEQDLAEARRIVETFEASERQGTANVRIDGRLVDYPVAEAARRRLAAAGDGLPGSATRLPLAGVKVLDLSSLYAAPLIATNLADFGAEVIKVEHPQGDGTRNWGLAKDGVPLWWKVISRNKRVISLDLHDEHDREIVRRLAAWADVLIENFRPGRLEAWDLGPAILHRRNPGLIVVRMTGFGQTGPNSGQPGFGTLAEAFSGFAYITGQADGPPTLPPFGLADGVAGLMGTFATLVALYWRDAQRGDKGQVVDLSLYEPLFSILGPQIPEYTQLGIVQERHGNRSPRTTPRNAYRTADQHWVALSGGTQQVVNRMLAAIDRPELADDPRFRDPASRKENADALDDLIAAWIGEHSLDDVLRRFRDAEAPIAPVYDIRQIVADDHYRARGSIIEVADDDLGAVAMPNVVPRLSLTPGSVRWAGRTQIGADTDEVLRQILGIEPNASPTGEPDAGGSLGDR